MLKDAIWKAILEDLAEEMLHFFFPKYVNQIDFSRGIEFLDKELQKIYPKSGVASRRADKLMKVWLYSGVEAWFLIHFEVQGYYDPQFDLRMFQSAYRILDKFNKPLVALAIYTHPDRLGHVNEYRRSFMGTEFLYRFNTYCLIDHPPEELANSSNIFAAVLEAAGTEIFHGASNEEKMDVSLSLVQRLLKIGWQKEKVYHVLNFIKYSIRLNEQESIKFEEDFENLTQHKGPMGIQEVILDELKKRAIKEGQEQGRLEGKAEGKAEGLELANINVISRGLQQGLTLDVLASLTGLSMEEVENIAKQLCED